MPNNQSQTPRSTSPSGEGDIESLTVSLTTSPRKLVKAVRQLQVEKRTAEALTQSLRRKLADITNDSLLDTSTQPKSKRVKTGHANDELNSSDEETVGRNAEQFVIRAGHKFCITCGPWLHSGTSLFQIDLDDTYSPAERFENEERKSQAQLREVWDLLQAKFESQDLKQAWVAKAFLIGLNAQRSNTATRVRRHCASIFGIDESDLMRSETRKEKFRNRIGWVVDARGNGSYSSVDVEILHKSYSGEYNPSSAFLSPVLTGLFIAIIRGPTAGKEFMMGITSNPRTETMASIHGLRNITPGAIATVAIFARWALSADEFLQPIGSTTGINYFSDYEEYINILQTGLHRKKKTIINIIKEWDHQVFPNTDTSLVGGSDSQESTGLKKAMALLDADSDEEEGIFGDGDH
ncbi:hypothetical protein BDZ97DRAFT_1877561 [Flammula alnicola]|nr:hypothetical protein BDZ97DRAFT_1877561 [Flammula alnicola]